MALLALHSWIIFLRLKNRMDSVRMSERSVDLSEIGSPEMNEKTEETEDNEVVMVNSTTLENLQIQSEVLDFAIKITDPMLYPNKSMLVMEGTQPTASLQLFHEIYKIITSSREGLKPKS